MSIMEFVQFTEDNDHEGETWTYWLQVDGNEEELRKFADYNAKLDNAYEQEGSEPTYKFQDDVREPEGIVDKLVEYAEVGYRASHSKVTGKFVCPEWEDIDAADDLLYKGGIEDCFTKEDQ